MTSTKVSGRQLVALLVLVRMTPQTLNCTTLNAVVIPQIGLVADAIGVTMSVPLIYLVAKAGAWNHGDTAAKGMSATIDRYMAAAVNVLLIPYFLTAATMTLASVGLSFSTAIMPETPVIVFIAIIAFLSANAVRSGVEVIGRLSETLTPLVVLALLLIAGLSINRLDLGYLRPIFLPNGFQDLVTPSGSVFSFSTLLMVVYALAPHLDSPKSGITCSLLAILITGLLIVVMCIVIISAFGPATNSILLHAFTLARTASLGPFLQRFEVVMMAVWTVGAATSTAVLLWAAAEGVKSLFALRTSAPLAYALGMLVTALSVTGFRSEVDFVRFALGAWIVYATATAAVVALLSLSITLIRGRRRQRTL